MIFIQNTMEVYNEESLSLYTERINRTTVTEKKTNSFFTCISHIHIKNMYIYVQKSCLEDL